ncbi:hypothetical protein [Sphingobium abikonense]|uniref:hypothetical protein n=1 Tax=Sphingobium abikonense TaxID=86193 RepID=UPI000788AB87|nr:hypothetical protein [Sphingobium abikonense]
MTIARFEDDPAADGWSPLFQLWQMPWQMTMQWWDFYTQALQVSGLHFPYGKALTMPKEQEPLDVEEAEGLCA